ncbi:lipoprotein N-acyltransferase Lnb domain-containing protein [Altibacter sp. HG106]|uniref:lipoprotein N-acyltransferase Lnb domain-containing protein n=1 Tax=Altibacter sp. HG106 TaxID=3023937 RepID=UPI0023505376|nr:DUF4105 domain-containing protein [Altibacter sp. HG106]MDC7995688.1 DUF4105 domain-containing protein [Altibacter sp. HG106]
MVSLSPEAEVSLITVGPGENLYDSFGHTAIRIQDPKFDYAYNYGVYDFDTPNFYTKFARGKLLYQLEVWPFDQFLAIYKRQDRTVEEQVLDLSYPQKKAFFEFLQNNAKPENSKYLYDFFYDNCATKPRDVLTNILAQNDMEYGTYVENPKTFRELIRENVALNSWGSLGMDVAIGAVTDRVATPWEHQFLPKYVAKATATATIKKEGTRIPLVKERKVLYKAQAAPTSGSFFVSPLFLFGLLSVVILWITYRDWKQQKRSRFLDGVLFLVTGLIGVALAFLWWGTDHSATAYNYNLLWAFPLSLLFCYGISRKFPKAWMQRYVIFLLLLLLLLTFHWITGVQRFAIGFIPLFFALLIRYVYVVSFLKKQRNVHVA